MQDYPKTYQKIYDTHKMMSVINEYRIIHHPLLVLLKLLISCCHDYGSASVAPLLLLLLLPPPIPSDLTSINLLAYIILFAAVFLMLKALCAFMMVLLYILFPEESPIKEIPVVVFEIILL